MFNMQPIRYTTKLFKPMMPILNNFRYLTSEKSPRIKTLFDCFHFKFYKKLSDNSFPEDSKLPHNKRLIDIFNIPNTHFGMLLPQINKPKLSFEVEPTGSSIEKQYRMNKFVSEHKDQNFEPFSKIIANRSKNTNVVKTLIFSPENVVNEEQMFDLLRLIKFGFYNEQEEFRIYLDKYTLKYSNILSGHMNFEIFLKDKDNDFKLNCLTHKNQIYTMIVYIFELFNETPPKLRNEKNYELMKKLYMKYVWNLPIKFNN